MVPVVSRVLKILFSILQWGILIQAAFYILVYTYVVCKRISYPFELEWMEGGVLDHVRRVLAGQPLYVKPSIEFIPFIYTPFYYYVSAGFSKIAGNGFGPLRLVSFFSSLGCFGIIYAFVRRESGSIIAGAASAGLFAATYRVGGAWLDLARVDSLFLLFLLWSIYILRSRETVLNSIIAAILLTLSFLTKQFALFMGIFMAIYALIAFKNANKLVFPLVLAFLVAACVIIANYFTNGWFSYYIFELPRQHGFTAPYKYAFWSKDLLAGIGIASGMSLFYAIRLSFSGKRNDAIFTWLMLVGMILMSWISRLHLGGYDDVLMPAFAAIVIFFRIVPRHGDSRPDGHIQE